MTPAELNDLRARRDAAQQVIDGINVQMDELIKSRMRVMDVWAVAHNAIVKEELKQKLRDEIANEKRE